MNNFFEKAINHLYKHRILWSFLAVFTVSLFDAIYYFLSEEKLFYVDTDCYTRALRIIDWLQHFQWAEKIFPYSNVPDGFVLHFTRINDMIWVALSLPFMLFEPLKEAIFHGGFFFSPLFLFLSLCAFFWGIQPYIIKFEKTAVSFALVFITTLLFCYKLTNIFDFFRPDHHSVMFFIFCFNIAVILRFLNNTKENYFLFAGSTCGLGFWFSSAIEGILSTAIILAILCFNWLYGTLKSKHLIAFNLGLFISITFAWLINPPYGGFSVLDNSRLSIIHVVLTALMLLAFISLKKADSTTPARKIIYLNGCGIIVILLIFMIFESDTLLKPIYHEKMHTIYLPYITEMQPIYKTPFAYYYQIISWILGILLVCYLLYQSKSQKIRHLNLALLTFFTIPLGFAAVRLYLYYIAVFLYLNGCIIFSWMALSSKFTKYRYAIFFYLAANVFFLTSFQSVSHPQKIPHVTEKIENLATDYNISPQFCWDLDVKTLATPYHTDETGLIDNHKLFFSSDEDEIKNILQQHQIKYIYLPKTEFNDNKTSYRSDYYIEPEKNTDKFYGKIMTGQQIYNWLEVVPTNLENSSIYKVKYDLF